MSVIAWDGKSLAADKRACCNGLIRTITKAFDINGVLVAYAGNADGGEEVVNWFKSGHDPEKFPQSQRGDNWSGLIAIFEDGEIWRYESTPYPIKFPPQHFAIGSGRDYAMAAMYLGKTSAESVEIASVFDNGCGNGVDVLTHRKTC